MQFAENLEKLVQSTLATGVQGQQAGSAKVSSKHRQTLKGLSNLSKRVNGIFLNNFKCCEE